MPAFRVKLGANDLNCVDVALNPTHSLTLLADSSVAASTIVTVCCVCSRILFCCSKIETKFRSLGICIIRWHKRLLWTCRAISKTRGTCSTSSQSSAASRTFSSPSLTYVFTYLFRDISIRYCLLILVAPLLRSHSLSGFFCDQPIYPRLLQVRPCSKVNRGQFTKKLKIYPKIFLSCVLSLSYDTDWRSAKIISRFS